MTQFTIQLLREKQLRTPAERERERERERGRKRGFYNFFVIRGNLSQFFLKKASTRLSL